MIQGHPRNRSGIDSQGVTSITPMLRDTRPAASASMLRGVLRSFLGRAVHLREIGLVTAAYFAYMHSRTLVHPDYQEKALVNAWWIIDLERSLGVFWEPVWQSWAVDNARELVVFLNWTYIVIFWPIIALVSVTLYVADRGRYRYYRKITLLSFALALLVFMLFPLAPPRMIEELFVGTIETFGPSGYAGRDFSSYYNPYAAMPSLHFGWTVMFGVMFLRTTMRWVRALGVVYPALMLFCITVTGNHYIVDAVGGVLVIGVSFLAVELCRHRRLSPLALPDWAPNFGRSRPGRTFSGIRPG